MRLDFIPIGNQTRSSSNTDERRQTIRDLPGYAFWKGAVPRRVNRGSRRRRGNKCGRKSGGRFPRYQNDFHLRTHQHRIKYGVYSGHKRYESTTLEETTLNNRSRTLANRVSRTRPILVDLMGLVHTPVRVGLSLVIFFLFSPPASSSLEAPSLRALQASPHARIS